MAIESTEARLAHFVACEMRKGITLLELYHCANQQEALVRQYPLSPGDAEEIDIADEIFGDAVEMAECHATPQRFALRSFIKANSPACGKFDFLVQPSKGTTTTQLRTSEPPIERGLLLHLIKHTETAFTANLDLARQVAAMHKARADTAETEFRRYLAEKERFAGVRAVGAQKEHEQRLAATEAERDHEIRKLAMEELSPLFRVVAPHLGRGFVKVLDGVLGRKESPRSAPSQAPQPPPPPPSGPPAGEPSAERDDQRGPGAASGQDGATPGDSQTRPDDDDDDMDDARREELVALLPQITEEDMENLKKALGAEKVERIMLAVVDMLR